MPKHKWEMVTVNLFVGKSRKVWETINVPLLWMEYLGTIARKKRVSIDIVFQQAVMEMINDESRSSRKRA